MAYTFASVQKQGIGTKHVHGLHICTMRPRAGIKVQSGACAFDAHSGQGYSCSITQNPWHGHFML